MNFTEFAFLVFFPLFLLFYFGLRGDLQKQNLLVAAASYFFYGWFDWRFCLLLVLSTAMDFYFGLVMDRAVAQRDRMLARFTLAASLIANLGLLGFFKYFNFFVDQASAVSEALGLGPLHVMWQVALPAGISFYTFQSLSYIFDVYDGKIRATPRFLDYAVFVSFFPHLVAGPILRAADLLPKVMNRRPMSRRMFLSGVQLALWGFFVKLVIADNMAPIVERAFNNPAARGAVVIVGVYAFAFQIYCDFMGYTSIARGIARMMGFELVLNFNLPYFAANPSEFWRRWHISLSTWLRDYLYIRLGGSRTARWKVYRNLLATMVLGGLWHGANWTFIIWGFYHGLMLCAHRACRDAVRLGAGSVPRPVLKLIGIVAFFQFTCLGWLIFRSASATDLAVKLSSIALTTELSGFWTPDASLAAAFAVPLIAFEFVSIRGGRALSLGAIGRRRCACRSMPRCSSPSRFSSRRSPPPSSISSSRGTMTTAPADRSSYPEFAGACLLAAAIVAALLWRGHDVQLWSDSVNAAQRVVRLVHRPAPAKPAVSDAAFNPTGNPFLQFEGEAGFRFHPLIGIAGTIWPARKPYFAERDYFGFRNDWSPYFDRTPHRYVVITGNSEMLGVTHATPVAKKLEAILRKRTNEDFRVVNLAMNSATTAHEINYFVNLAFNLHPEFVISHSFAADGARGNIVPDELQYLGLFPLDFEVSWATAIHGGNIAPRAFDVFVPLNRRFLLDGAIKNVQRYQAIAQSSGAHFIWGIQKFEWRAVIGTPAEAAFHLADELYHELLDHRLGELAGVDMIDFNKVAGLDMYSAKDPIHTDEASSRRIAELYADRIIERMRGARDRRPVASRPAPVSLTPTVAPESPLELMVRRLRMIAETTAGNAALVEAAALAAGLRPGNTIIGNIDMFHPAGNGQVEVRGWAIDEADRNREVTDGRGRPQQRKGGLGADDRSRTPGRHAPLRHLRSRGTVHRLRRHALLRRRKPGAVAGGDARPDVQGLRSGRMPMRVASRAGSLAARRRAQLQPFRQPARRRPARSRHASGCASTGTRSRPAEARQ